jgi:hypothetical protein
MALHLCATQLQTMQPVFTCIQDGIPERCHASKEHILAGRCLPTSESNKNKLQGSGCSERSVPRRSMHRNIVMCGCIKPIVAKLNVWLWSGMDSDRKRRRHNRHIRTDTRLQKNDIQHEMMNSMLSKVAAAMNSTLERCTVLADAWSRSICPDGPALPLCIINFQPASLNARPARRLTMCAGCALMRQ